MKLFGKKSKGGRPKGPGKSPILKAKEAEAKRDEFLSKKYLDYLKVHPAYAMEVAREKFESPIPPETYKGEDGEQSPDLLKVLRTAREAKSLVRDELGGEKQGGWLQTLPEIMKALPSFAEGLRGMVPGMMGQPETQSVRIEQPQQPRIELVKQPQLEAKKPTVDDQQQKIINLSNRLLSFSPQDAAMEIFQHRNGAKEDVLAVLYRVITENTFEDLVSMIPMVIGMPQYQFLAPLVSKTDNKQLALIYDEVIAQKNRESLGNQGV